jgi:phosphate transport system protein
MREMFQQELSELQDRLVDVSILVTTAITKATQAFGESDVALAEEVIEEDHLIDERALSLDELAIQILARQQPVARDLRIVVSALRISSSLERMGDMADHIAQLTRYRFPEKVVAKGLRGTFKKMGTLDIQVAETLTKLLKSQNLKHADKIRDLDDEIDALHLSVFDKVLGETWGGTPVDTVDATLASRYLERFADHAVNISKKVKYLSTGEWTSDGTARIDIIEVD